MKDILENLKKEFEPQLAIMVYKAKGHGEYYYLESHGINEQGQITEGKPLEQDTIHNMVDLFFSQRKDTTLLSGSIPDGLLSYAPLPGGNYNIMWYRPAEIRVMHFAQQLKLPTARVWVPPVVYSVRGNSLSVFALKASTRPKDETKLFRAPFHNVSDDGLVCLGSARVKKPSERSFKAAMKYWEDLFWLSEFTHLNGASNPTKSDFNKVWKKMLTSRTKQKWSDIPGELKQTKKTIQTLLK
ncbi:MAG: PRTRC system protein B [Chitinophagaceae bacterium]|nr:MAG: PRTRC system protein B [Chitinophagaceae bacterium]